MIGERLVVERRHLGPAGGLVQRERLGENGARLDVRHACPALPRARLERVEQPPPESETARRRRDPHPLDLGRRIGVMLDGAAADRLTVEIGEEESARWRANLVRLRGGADRWIKAPLGASVELGDVFGEAVPGIRMLRVDGQDRDARGDEQPFDLSHGRDQLLPLACAQRLEQRLGEPIRAPVERGTLASAGGREPRDPPPPVILRRGDGDESGGFKCAEQPARVARIKPEPGAQEPHLASGGPDLPEQPSLAERAPAPEEALV